jgi:hypothetical protein
MNNIVYNIASHPELNLKNDLREDTLAFISHKTENEKSPTKGNKQKQIGREREVKYEYPCYKANMYTTSQPIAALEMVLLRTLDE